jgi:pentatricopeptide repeat protein
MGRARKLNQAFSIVEELCTAYGFRPNVHVHTCLVQACIQNRQLDRAITVHQTMIQETGCQPDQKFYSVLARGCLQAGSPNKAVGVVRCAHHLPGHDLVTPRAPVGVEPKVLEEVLGKLKAGSIRDQKAAEELRADLGRRGRPHGQ